MSASVAGPKITDFRVQTPELQANSDGRTWNRVKWNTGNYTVQYRGFDRPVQKLVLEIIAEPPRRIHLHAARSGVGLFSTDKLAEFLGHVHDLHAWGKEVPCRLVATVGGEAIVSNESTIRAPVPPWPREKGLEPAEFAKDTSIRYCSVNREQRDEEIDEVYFGRDLQTIGGFRCFTYKDVLETDMRWRGFACIGFVAVIKSVRHNPKITGQSPTLIEELNGKTFDVPAELIKGRPFQKEVVTGMGRFTNQVTIGPALLCDFLETPQGQTGDYYIWRPGHAGIIRNGNIYECKPSGRGFTESTIVPGRQSAVCRWTPREFLNQLKSGAPFFVSQL